MTGTSRLLVVVRTRDPHRQAEALRAALGLTLRGSGVDVILDEPPATPLAQRAVDTLLSFGHRVAAASASELAAAIREARAVEVWT